MDNLNKIKELIDYLNKHTQLYDENKPEISDTEWDKKYFELVELEKVTGIVYPNSPTQIINYQVVTNLEKVKHNHPMLSLPKTKDMNEAFTSFPETIVAMLKMDGLTCSLTYENGELVAAETRGDGEVGENVFHNIKTIANIPQTISTTETLIIDGEIIVTNNNWLKHKDDGYKTQRAYASGSLRLLDAAECVKRDLSFIAWDVINPTANLNEELRHLKDYGFSVVPHYCQYDADVKDSENQINIVNALTEAANELGYPYDGIVIKVDDYIKRQSYTSTSHHLGGAIAYKFVDEEYKTYLLDIEYEPSRNGYLTPVAVFEPVEFDDGSTVTRASLHNLSIMESLSEGFERVGDTLYIYKSNMIIPQISKWIHTKDYSEEWHIKIPETCPVCGEPTIIKQDVDTKILCCSNPNCEGRLINRLDHFLGKKGLDIKGISKATLEKLIDWEWVTCIEDLFHLDVYKKEWIQKPGFGIKSVEKMLDNLAVKNPVELHKFICALGIPEIGSTASKLLCKYIDSYDDFRNKINSRWNFSSIDTIGPVMEDNILKFSYAEADALVKYLDIVNTNNDAASSTVGNKKFVITGSLTYFKNRAELTAAIESCGGKVVNSVSKVTDYLVCNDKDSNTSKHISAKKYNIPIISEEECISLLGLN